MNNFGAFMLLLGAAYGLQWIEGKLSLGGLQGKVAWVVSIISVALALFAGTYIVGGINAITKFFTGWGYLVPIGLGALGAVAIVFVVLIAVPPKWSATVAGAGALGAAVIVPALWPHVVTDWHLLVVYAQGGSVNLQGLVH